jgi:outer membrane protein OmpA-like peptidoglycan-associated protein
VNNATGLVSFATTSSSTALNVSVNGAITTTGLLTQGIYSVAGTDSDPGGDTGRWAYTLTVYSPVSVTFVANGGQGSMTPETKSAPTALTPNVFTRSKYKFAHWNTVADGSGMSYANGVLFPFTASTTLYAQWTASTKIAPTRKVTFDANGGSGSMKPESKNVLASLKSNKFQRKGFSFIDWNTAANGSKASYANDAAYRFTKSATLFAQWRAAATFTVTFDANRGSGSMSPETEKATAALTFNRFKRHGFTFDRWNTAANGSGSNYANGAAYHFNTSTILFAQWTVVKPPVVKPPVVLPAVHAVVALSPFAAKSTTLSTSLAAQIAALAREIKANRDKKIALVGYSGDLTTANITNESDLAASLKLSMQRAVVVESYLKQQLTLLGVTGYTITAVGSGAAIPVSSNTTAADQAKNRKVVATIT